eukprot:4614491-Prymnesium_polylepis.1
MTIGHLTSDQGSGVASGLCGNSGTIRFNVDTIPFVAQNSALQSWTDPAAANILPSGLRRGARHRRAESTPSSPLSTDPPLRANGAMAAAPQRATPPAVRFDWYPLSEKIQLGNLGGTWGQSSIKAAAW